MFSSFCAFSLFILMVFWLCFGVFSSNMYFWVMRSRMDDLGYEILLMGNRSDFAEKAESMALNEQSALLVYRIENGEFIQTAFAKHDASSVIHELDGLMLAELYTRASEQDGKCRVRFLRNEQGSIIEQTGVVMPASSRLVTAMVKESGNGGKTMVILDTAVTMPQSFVRVTRNLMLILSLLLFGVSAIISFIVAKRVSYPIEWLNERAKDLTHATEAAWQGHRSFREIEELMETLERAAEELSRVDRMQKELIANISHDLRTPLTMIIGYAEVMRDIEGENNPENMQVIIDESRRLASLVNDLLEISRIQADASPLLQEHFSLSDDVEQTVIRYQHLKESAGYRFHFEGCAPSDVLADRKKVLRVVCNLLNNAINYAGEDREIIVRCLAAGTGIRVEVEDHGMGIPESEIEHIWQRYYKVKQTHRRATVGSGLGLSIVREILDAHEARYGVISRIGEGSVFWFELPLHIVTKLPEECAEAVASFDSAAF